MENKGTDGQLTLLVSLEPRAYSEVIGYTIEAMRPQLAVEIVQPDSLCSEVERMEPEIVLCSESYCNCDTSFAPYWLEYYPYAEVPVETVRVNGKGSGLVNVEMKDLIDLVDRAEAFIDSD